jgi:hypothetical protein
MILAPMYCSSEPPPASGPVSGAEEQTFYLTSIDTAPLPAGTNVVAVEIHQNAANSSDLGFNLELVGNGQHVITAQARGQQRLMRIAKRRIGDEQALLPEHPVRESLCAEFKQQLRQGTPKMGLFLNAHSPTVAEQLAHSGYDWLLVDSQHGPMGYETLSGMLAGIANGGAISLVRVGGHTDRPGIQQALDMGANGILCPFHG